MATETMPARADVLWRAGAWLYAAWGVLHVVVGGIPAVQYLASGPEETLSFHLIEVAAADAELASAARLLASGGAVLAAVGVASAMVAMLLVARGDERGFWINAILAGIVDVAFVAAELTTGHRPLVPSIIGPVLYVLALGATTVAFTRSRRPD